MQTFVSAIARIHSRSLQTWREQVDLSTEKLRKRLGQKFDETEFRQLCSVVPNDNDEK